VAKPGEYTILLIGTSAGVPTPHDGRYISGYESPGLNPDLTWMGGYIETTADIKQALGFPTGMAALLKYREANGIRPYDGEPNRPLTAWYAEISVYEQAH
jgi:hypothetical protein